MLFLTALLFVSAIIGTLAVPVEKIAVTNKDYLLPDNAIIPSSYDINIDVSNSFPVGGEAPTKFTGSVKITAKAKTSTTNITLHAADMTITPGSISVYYPTDPGTNKFSSHLVDAERQFLHLEVQQIDADKEFVIAISYEGKLQNNMKGFYVSSYYENNDSTKQNYVLTTQFQPTHARKAFPCFDEPKYKASFLITIKKPAEYTSVISNMPGSTTINTEVKFSQTNVMSTYLVAFIVSKFNFKQSTDPNYKVWSRPEAISQTQVAVDASEPLVKILNEFTGIKYDKYVPKLDMAALPDFSAGAMENWGLLTYRETALLFDEKLSTNRDLQRIVTVIAHELGHQWFGNLVTTEWWDNTWLNEGFARYIEYMITGKYKPEWEMNLQFVVEQLQNIFEVDALQKTTPLNRAVYTPEEISSHFGTISYSKGGSVIRMMEHFLGTNAFKKGLNAYLINRTLSSSVPNNLWENIEPAANEMSNLEYSLDKIMNLWINQPGYPLVTVKVNKEYVTFEQKRFLLNTNLKEDATEKWFIPISYTTSSEKRFNETLPNLWLTPQTPLKIIPLNASDWIIANIQETGYFRVNYDDENWKNLAKALKKEEEKKSIDRINRAQIVDDVMNLARAGIVEYQIAFDLVDYLSTESDYYPWYSAFRVFRFLLQRYSETDGAGEQLRIYIKNRMKTLLKGKSLNTLDSKNQIDIFNIVSTLEWACNLGVEDCVKDAKALFKGDDTKINKNFRSIIYCTAISSGTEADWEKLRKRYVSSNVAAEKVGIINALGCSKNKKILDSYLKQSIESPDIRSQDASYVFSAVYSSGSVGVTAALEFLKENPQKIIDNYGGLNALDTAVLGLAGRLTDQTQIDKLTEILGDNVFDNIRQAALETAKENLDWAKKHSSNIQTILKKKNSAFRSLINQFAMYLSLTFVTIFYLRN